MPAREWALPIVAGFIAGGLGASLVLSGRREEPAVRGEAGPAAGGRDRTPPTPDPGPRIDRLESRVRDLEDRGAPVAADPVVPDAAADPGSPAGSAFRRAVLRVIDERREEDRRQGFEKMAPTVWEMVTRRIKLPPEEAEKIRPLFDELAREVARLSKESPQATAAEKQEFRRRMAELPRTFLSERLRPHLTPDQYMKLMEMFPPPEAVPGATGPAAPAGEPLRR